MTTGNNNEVLVCVLNKLIPFPQQLSPSIPYFWWGLHHWGLSRYFCAMGTSPSWKCHPGMEECVEPTHGFVFTCTAVWASFLYISVWECRFELLQVRVWTRGVQDLAVITACFYSLEWWLCDLSFNEHLCSCKKVLIYMLEFVYKKKKNRYFEKWQIVTHC